MLTLAQIQMSVDLIGAALRADGGFFATQPLPVIQEAELRYKRFLRLVQIHPDQQLSPAKDIDEMWHLHMLHPVKYHNDCLANFGGILDHDGGFGSGSPDEWRELTRIFEQTARLWRRHYGEDYRGSEESAAKCRKACAKCAVKCRKACRKAQADRQRGACVD